MVGWLVSYFVSQQSTFGIEVFLTLVGFTLKISSIHPFTHSFTHSHRIDQEKMLNSDNHRIEWSPLFIIITAI